VGLLGRAQDVHLLVHLSKEAAPENFQEIIVHPSKEPKGQFQEMLVHLSGTEPAPSLPKQEMFVHLSSHEAARRPAQEMLVHHLKDGAAPQEMTIRLCIATAHDIIPLSHRSVPVNTVVGVALQGLQALEEMPVPPFQENLQETRLL
jgi:hypothetical protein